MTSEEVIREARSWLKTPWRHQGRLKGIAVDCAGLVIEVGKAVGALPIDGQMDRTDYGREPEPARIRGVLDKYFDIVPKEGRRPGDVLLMKSGKHPQHLGILTDYGLIHAMNAADVAEHRLDGYWKSKILAVYRFRGIEWPS